MKLSDGMIRDFERQQAEFGTKVALSNVIWELASDMFRAIGVKNIKTTYHGDDAGQTLEARLASKKD